jgi:hypothetical protein
VHHIGTDTLVGWAWAPGFGRRPAPGTQKQAGALVEAWVQTGAVVRSRTMGKVIPLKPIRPTLRHCEGYLGATSSGAVRLSRG